MYSRPCTPKLVPLRLAAHRRVPVARRVTVSNQRVQKLIELSGIRAKGKRRLKVTTDSNYKLPISPNLLHHKFTVAEPDKVWVGDVS